MESEQQEKDSNKKPPSQADVYMESRKRTSGHTYLTTNDDTLKNIEQMKSLKSLNDESSERDPNFDPYYAVITKKEHSGRLRLYGGGVTKSKLKKKDAKTPFIVPPVFLEAIAENMQKNITEQVQQSIAKQMDQQISFLLSKIRDANPGINLVVPDFSTNEGDDASSSHDNVDGDYNEDN